MDDHTCNKNCKSISVHSIYAYRCTSCFCLQFSIAAFKLPVMTITAVLALEELLLVKLMRWTVQVPPTVDETLCEKTHLLINWLCPDALIRWHRQIALSPFILFNLPASDFQQEWSVIVIEHLALPFSQPMPIRTNMEGVRCRTVCNNSINWVNTTSVNIFQPHNLWNSYKTACDFFQDFP